MAFVPDAIAMRGMSRDSSIGMMTTAIRRADTYHGIVVVSDVLVGVVWIHGGVWVLLLSYIEAFFGFSTFEGCLDDVTMRGGRRSEEGCPAKK